jgi:hypothetical protein
MIEALCEKYMIIIMYHATQLYFRARLFVFTFLECVRLTWYNLYYIIYIYIQFYKLFITACNTNW